MSFLGLSVLLFFRLHSASQEALHKNAFGTRRAN